MPQQLRHDPRAGRYAHAVSHSAGPVKSRTSAPDLIRELYHRVAHIIHELGKFGTVGACAYVVDVVIFNVVRDQTGEPVTAKVISTVVATTAAFVGNRFWTWRHYERSGLTREYLLYFGFNLVGLVISLACLWVSHYWLGAIWPGVFAGTLADNISGNVIGTGLASVFRFWAYRRYVFRPATQRA
ncbi:MAG: GtrA family protein [Micromonosporaceae bacterium]